jgi:polar amino acid transport system substrate-binding protein
MSVRGKQTNRDFREHLRFGGFMGAAGKTLRLAAATIATFGVVAQMGADGAQAGPLLDKVKAGQPIRIGYANIKPWCYEADDGAMRGFTNEITVGALKEMGVTNLQSVIITDWAGYIPGLQAKQYDIASCGLMVLASRCASMKFSNPIAVLTDSFLVPKGNPAGINTWEDVIKTKATVVTTTGTNIAEEAKKAGVPESQLMLVPTKNEVLQAIYSGRAKAGVYAYLENLELVNSSEGKLEATDPHLMPEEARNWPAVGFRQEDTDFVDAFNKGLAKYLGTPEMMSAVADDLYTAASLPDKNVTSDWVCKNR